MDEQQKEVVEYYVNSYNDFDINGMTKNLTENVVFKNISNENVELRTVGLNEFEKQAELAKQYFTQRKQTIEFILVNNENIKLISKTEKSTTFNRINY